MKFCHLLTLMSIQTCMTFFLLWNTKEDILKKKMLVHTIEINGHQNSSETFRIYSMFHRMKGLKQSE